MAPLSINHLSNQDLVQIFTYLPTNHLQLVSHRWMNICTSYFPQKYHLILENVTLSSHSAVIQIFKKSKRVIEKLTLSNVDLDFSDKSDFSEVLVFLKRLQSSVTELSLQHSIKPNADLIRGFQKVQKLEICSPGWYCEIANGKVSFPEVRFLRLNYFNIEIFGKNMFVSFFRKVSYVEEIEIEGNVIRNYSQFGTFFGKKLKKIHFDVENENLAMVSMEFLTIIKGINLNSMTFVMRTMQDVDILDRFTACHPALQDIRVICKGDILPNPHPNIKSFEITLEEEIIGVFKAIEYYYGLSSISVNYPLRQNHVQVNCFFGHEFIEPNPNITTLKISGYNKDCLTCFNNLVATYPNIKVLEYASGSQIDMEVVQILGSNLVYLEDLTLISKNYEKSSKSIGFGKYFKEWPKMKNLKKIKLEPISWQWSNEGLVNFCQSCPLLENVHFDGGIDIDDEFHQPLMTHLRYLRSLTIGDTAAKAFDIPQLEFMFAAEQITANNDYQTIEMTEQHFQQPCAWLKELRLLTCTLDMSLKLRLFQNLKMLQVIQDRKTLMTSKQFHEMRNQFQHDVLDRKENDRNKRPKRSVKKFILSCFCQK